MTGSQPDPAPGPGRAGAWSDAVRLAMGTLTAVPVPPPSMIDTVRAGRAMTLAPLVGAVPALAAAATAEAWLRAGGSALVAAALALAAAALVTRGLHLDGLADTADGLAAAYDRARALEVMRRGDSGPAGVAALVLTLLIQLAAAAEAMRGLGPVALLVALVAGRCALPVACRRGMPAARPTGLGATVAGSVGIPAVAASVGIAAACAGGLAVAGAGWGVAGGGPALRAAATGAAAVLVGVAAASVLLHRCRGRLGGVTGDVLGASVEVATTAALLLLALA